VANVCEIKKFVESEYLLVISYGGGRRIHQCRRFYRWATQKSLGQQYVDIRCS
jgi:hypothetical protein